MYTLVRGSNEVDVQKHTCSASHKCWFSILTVHSMVVSVPSTCGGCISSSLLRIGFLVEKEKNQDVLIVIIRKLLSYPIPFGLHNVM